MTNLFHKTLAVMLGVFLLFTGASSVKADAFDADQASKSVVEIIREQQTVSSEHAIFDTDRFEEQLRGYTLTDKAILTGYYGPLTGIIWDDGQNYTVDEFLDYLKNQTVAPEWNIAFGENDVRDIWICKDVPAEHQWKYRGQNDELVVADAVFFTSPEYGLPQFAKDILSDEIYRSPLHKKDDAYSQITFYGMAEWGMVVFYFTENDAIVRCYDGFFPQAYLYPSETKEYTWQQFQEYAVVYSEYLRELQEKGILLAGSQSFNQFVEQFENGTITLETNKDFGTWIIWGLIICVCIVAAIFLLVKLIKKKRTV